MKFISNIFNEYNTVFQGVKRRETGALFRGDKAVWAIFFAMSLISILAVYSATSTIVYKYEDPTVAISRHVIHLLLGVALVLIIQYLPYRFFSSLVLLFIVSIGLLGATLLMGESVNGAQRWFQFAGFSLQPSELTKIALVGTLAFCLSRTTKQNEKFMQKVMTISIMTACGLIFTENLSTAALLFIVSFLMLFIGQASWRYMLLFLGSIFLIGVLFCLLFFLLPEDKQPQRMATWKARIERFLSSEELTTETENVQYVLVNGEKKPYILDDKNYQEMRARMAVANGYKLIGVPGSGVERDFLPQAYSDFIFSIIIEETGILGGLFVLSLYVFLLIRCGIIASKCPKRFPKYLVLGLSLTLVIQALVNMAVATGAFPVTGQPLPLISRGGSSTIITCVYFGIILACSTIKEDKPDTSVDEDVANVHY